jgi:hypothetical protein
MTSPSILTVQCGGSMSFTTSWKRTKRVPTLAPACCPTTSSLPFLPQTWDIVSTNVRQDASSWTTRNLEDCSSFGNVTGGQSQSHHNCITRGERFRREETLVVSKPLYSRLLVERSIRTIWNLKPPLAITKFRHVSKMFQADHCNLGEIHKTLLVDRSLVPFSSQSSPQVCCYASLQSELGFQNNLLFAYSTWNVITTAGHVVQHCIALCRGMLKKATYS